LLAFCVAVICGLTPASSYADDWDKATKITVNVPFEIPGMVLPAGAYVIKIVDMPGDHSAVRFYSEDEMTVYATVLALPDFRLNTSENTVLTFYEAAPGSPRALREWFYPGHQTGLEFAYPEKRATQIAAFTGESVPTLRETEPASVVREKPSPAPVFEAPVEPPAIAAEPAPAPEVSPEAPAPAPAGAALPELPKTATPFPLVAFIGLVAGGAASGLRWIRKNG